MANSVFKKFNRNSRTFNIDSIVDFLRKEENDRGELVNTYLRPQGLFEEDGNKSIPHQVVAVYRNEFSEETKAEYPDMPGYRYNLIVKLSAEDYVYVSAPVSMNEQFDEIMSDQSLIREIVKGNCAIAAYSFKTRDGEERYGLEFC